MKCCRVQVYVAGQKIDRFYRIRVDMTYDLAIEMAELKKSGYEWIWPLTESIGLYPGYQLVKMLKKLPWLSWRVQLVKSRWRNKIKKWLKKERWLNEWGVKILPEKEPFMISNFSDLSTEIGSNCPEIIKLRALLRGRNLYFSEIISGIKEMGLRDQTLLEVKKNLISLLVADVVEMVPANLPFESFCLRCGHTELTLTQCGICGERTWYCPECQSMGESLTCRPLFRRIDQALLRNQKMQEVELKFSFPLSPYQKKLSDYLVSGLKNDQVSHWLIWAVCGAGKTEITFALIADVLERGGRILFTSTRREVVRQMVDRMKKAFPKVSIVGLYGGSENKYFQSQLTIATIHQLVRFYHAFDLIIFDEVDAYPYQGDQRLKNLLKRSIKKEGKLVYLSATPGDDLLGQVRLGQVEMLTLPARFHRKGVPVPFLENLKLPPYPDFKKMPKEVRERIEETIYRDLAQLYIFLPTRRMVEIFGQTLHKYYNEKEISDWVQYTHSQDLNRSSKVEGFLRGDYPILATTTILERGVTVPKSNVLVLYADQEKIFQHQNLIQMAGRGGRSLYYPDAKVWFLGKRISGEMKKARKWIIEMNEEAKKRGLLDA
ncbi:MAG: DEAD/DEAH box helicase family protein [Halanaerobiales bacterium]|nr:DEAD/DEAH box helicase family protein [Halanaerobiales bacterium]